MFYSLLEDLRFVIGSFFGIVALILLVVGLISEASVVFGVNMNLLAGGIMAAFSILMFVLVFRARRSAGAVRE